MTEKWETKNLGDVITLQRGFDLPSQKRQAGTVPVVSSSGVSGSHSESRVRAPGVVTGRYGTIGDVHFLRKDFWPLNTTLFVADFKGNDERFVYYLLSNLDFSSFNDKSSVPGVNRNHLHRIPVRVPVNVEDQDAIARILGALDDKIELNRRMSQTLEEIARALFKSWFVDFDPVHAKAAGRQPVGMDAETAALFPSEFEDSELGLIPRGWRAEPFANTVSVLGGGTPRTSEASYWGGDIPWFSMADLPGPGELFVIATEKRITSLGLQNSSTRLLPEGTTILTARGTVGKLALVGQEMAMNQSCYGLEGHSAGPYFTYFRTAQLLEALRQRSHGSVFDTITRSTLDSLIVASPDAQLADRFESHVTSLLERIRSNLAESHTLTAMRDVLLPKLLSGALSAFRPVME